MKTYTFTLNIEVDARDAEQALEIAKACAGVLTTCQLAMHPFKLRNVEVDKVEEL